jgi:poly(A) polymerase
MTRTSFQPPRRLRGLLERTASLATDAGITAYVVGGTVRDVLLGREARDLDLAVDGEAMAFARRLAAAFDAHFVELDDVHAVARVVMPRGHEVAVDYVDVARLQGTLEQDLRRRDFTVDALAVEIGQERVIDLGAGLDDLAARVVRMNAPGVFDADPLRLLRAARIASELGFGIDTRTRDAIRARAGEVTRAAGERRRDELARIFALDGAYGALLLLDDLRLLDALLPEVTFGRGVTQPEQWHAYDVLEHNLRTVEAMDVMLGPPGAGATRTWLRDALWRAFAWCEGDLRAYLAEELTEGRTRGSLLKLASLLHDVAKPQTRSVGDDGRVRFFGHADEGAAIAARVMRRLRFSAAEVRFVAGLVAGHLRPVQLAQVGEAPTRRALYRFYRALGDGVPAVLLLALADAAASRGPSMTSGGWSRHVAYMNSLLVRSKEEEGIVHPPRLLTGDDVMRELGMAPGPAVGRVLEALREAQAAGEVETRDAALAFVRRAADGAGEGATGS